MQGRVILLVAAAAAAWALPALAGEPGIPPLPVIRSPPCRHLIRPAPPSGPSLASPIPSRPGADSGLRIHEAAAAACDFSGDGQGDAALFDGLTGHWYGFTIRGAPLFWAVPWGGPGGVPVPGDYDGDRVADLAVFAPETGLWSVRTVAGAVLLWEEPWGWPGAVPVPGDYDGDRLSDLALFDPATGLWHIQTRAGAVLLWGSPWGWPAGPDRPAAVPVPGDWNGDGRDDLVVRDAQTGRRYAREVSGQVLAWDQDMR